MIVVRLGKFSIEKVFMKIIGFINVRTRRRLFYFKLLTLKVQSEYIKNSKPDMIVM